MPDGIERAVYEFGTPFHLVLMPAALTTISLDSRRLRFTCHGYRHIPLVICNRYYWTGTLGVRNAPHAG
ncbi:Uncharacterised protein [Mycobacteroides abscessus subsp. abscessus]|nr:Uncharacterised protein [Mycobacteroides abscessus subsp. abscessus]SKF37450.1 Uncharacterised protein [Mycobacteroides abscessus subsp. abscessus]SLG43545.1 Uncharacterised protein [Mycobacteroides abscessus subsp. abscessus]